MDIFYLPNLPEDDGKFIDFCIQAFASLIGAGAAVWVYWNSIEKAKQKEEDSRIRFERDKLRYLHHLLNGGKKSIDSFISGLKNFIEDLEKDPIQLGSINMGHNYDLKRIVTNINQEEHFHAYKNQLKNSRIADIFNIIDFVYSQQLNIIPYLESRKLNNEKIKDFATSVDDTRNLLIKNIERIKSEHPNALPPIFDTLNYFKGRFIDANQNHKGEYSVMLNEFLTPLGTNLSS